jgi:NADP-dependent 3-hydroxy acid dehydrogenase YdfG
MHPFTKKFPKKRAFITGAASGLGLACCEILARDGWTIGMADIQEKSLLSAVEKINQLGGKALPYQLDVADKHAFKQVADDFLNKAGGIDILMNNAGVGDGGLFEEYDLEHWEWMVGINQMSVIYGCHYFIPTFKKQKSGHIINTASLAAVACAPMMGAYNMTKAAVVAISETLFIELMDYKIGVSCLQPFYFRTNIVQFARGGDEIRIATEAMMKSSGLTADEVAIECLERSANGELYILIPKIARQMWWMKRLFPTWFRVQIKKQIDQTKKKLEVKFEK